jgi:hypothetical protein
MFVEPGCVTNLFAESIYLFVLHNLFFGVGRLHKINGSHFSPRKICGRVTPTAPPPCGRLRPRRTSQYTYRLADHNLHYPPGLSGPFVVLAQGRGLRG